MYTIGGELKLQNISVPVFCVYFHCRFCLCVFLSCGGGGMFGLAKNEECNFVV